MSDRPSKKLKRRRKQSQRNDPAHSNAVLASADAGAQTPRARWLPNSWARLGIWWSSQTMLRRHWMINILLGVAIESLLICGHHYHWSFVTGFTNAGLDVMTRLSQSGCSAAESLRGSHGEEGRSGIERWMRCPSAGNPADIPLLLEVDERTWRSPAWGGGEPMLAPRDGLATLVERAFELGAKRVVVDVLIQDSRPTQVGSNVSASISPPTDAEFASRMRALIAKPYFGPDRLLTLVRTERAPLLDETNGGAAYVGAFLPTLRESSVIDPVIAESGGRIALAAPYYLVDPSDRLTRDWVLFKVHCKADAASPVGGWLQFVPSVQLLVATHALSVATTVVAPNPGDPSFRAACQPFPADAEPTSIAKKPEAMADDLAAQLYGGEQSHEAGMVTAYWARVRDAFNKKLPSGSELAGLPEPHSVGNRILYRYRYVAADSTGTGGAEADERTKDTGAMRRLSAHQVLSPTAGNDPLVRNGLRSILQDRTVVIGQTYRESGDVFYTPVGVMPGAAVLVNSIDSMRVYQLLRPTGGGLSIGIALALIVVVGYLFARWDSTTGTIAATAIVLFSVGIASFFVFQHGVWLDVAAPILGIQLHRLWAGWEERQELKARRAAAGADHH